MFQERSPFSTKLKGELVFEVRDEKLIIKLEINRADGLEPDTTQSSIDLAGFPSGEALIAFQQAVKRNFFERMRESLAFESALHLFDVCGFIAHSMGLDPNGKPAIIKRHLEKTEERLAQVLSPLPEKPRRAAWTPNTLEGAVRLAALALEEAGQKLTLDAVNAALWERYGDIAPASGEALRKQLALYEISWTTLKTEIRAIAKIRFSKGL